MNFLVVEDDDLFRLCLVKFIKTFGNTFQCKTVSEAKEIIESEHIDIAFIDLWLNHHNDGLKVLELTQNKNIYNVILSSSEDELDIENAYKIGCNDFLNKRSYEKNIEKVINKFLSNQQNKNLIETIKQSYLTQDLSLLNSIAKGVTLLGQKRSLYIEGETGVGKTHLVKVLSKLSNNDNLIHLNCAEISESLIESELFGHKKGSFTGAVSDKMGLIKKADHGILFLDEITTLSLNAQAKLLKAIEEKTYYPVGSTSPEKSDFLLISASCESIEDKIEDQKFRSDLYFRISNFKISIPSLRQRKSDIFYQLKEFLKDEGRQIVFDQQAKEMIINYDWPGNSRELKNLAILLVEKDNGKITVEDLPSDFLKKQTKQLNKGLNDIIKEVEQEYTLKAYYKNQKKIRPTLNELKISSTTLYRILKEAGIELNS